MRWAPVVPLWIAGAVIVLQPSIHAQVSDSQLPVSVERIRAALKQQPPVLQLAAPSPDTATFRIEVQERLPVLQPVDEKPFDPTFGLPSLGELVMTGIEKIGSAAVDYKRRRTERRARKEVDDALAAFCAVRHCATPDTGR